MKTNTRTIRSVLIFIVLVFVISVPFWLVGALIEQFMPKTLPINLPVSSLVVLNPMIIALILVFRESGTGGGEAFTEKAL